MKITHNRSGTVLADDPIGWGITPLEGNLYIRKKYLMCDGFKVNFLPGLCIYKFLCVWMDLVIPGQPKISKLAWLYWLPNPLFPFILYRVGLPAAHPELSVRRYSSDGNPHKA